MAHWRSFYDNRFLGHFDLPRDRDVVVFIEKVELGELVSSGGRKDKKPICKFAGKEKGLALCKTNSKVIAGIYGPDTDDWIGKPVALYVTQTSSPDGMVDCVRIRPTPPKKRPQRPQAEPAALPEASRVVDGELVREELHGES